MPFKSEKQRRYLHANHPEIAKRWERDYAHGGILDINESEEIIDDGGNEIELTDYNAAFDDPNDLSTGVKSLFRAKDGGRIGFYRGSPHDDSPTGSGTSSSNVGGSTSKSTSGGNQGSDQGHSRFDVGSGYYGEPTTTTPSTGDGPGNIHGGPTVQEALQRGALKKSALDFEKEKGGPEFYGIRKTQEIVNNARDDWEKVKNSTNENLKKKAGRKIIDQFFLGGATFGLGDIIGVMVQGYKQGKAKNEFIGVLNDSIEKYRDLGIPEHSPHTDTLIQALNQEILDLTQTKDTPDGDTGPDGPDLPEVVPIGEEIQEYASIGPDAGSTLASIRSKQALNAQLQAKWAAEQEARDQLYMVANKGGLANLFRVKKQ